MFLFDPAGLPAVRLSPHLYGERRRLNKQQRGRWTLGAPLPRAKPLGKRSFALFLSRVRANFGINGHITFAAFGLPRFPFELVRQFCQRLSRVDFMRSVREFQAILGLEPEFIGGLHDGAP